MKKSGFVLAVMSLILLTMGSCKEKVDYSLLDKWKGVYTVTAESYFGDALEPPSTDYDETWTVTVTKVEGSDSKLAFSGIGGDGALTVYATLDTKAMTISFQPGQDLGDVVGYGNVKIYYGSDDIISFAGADIDQSYIDDVADTSVEGTISNDGGILIDRFAEVVEGPSVWDVFKTTWVKQL